MTPVRLRIDHIAVELTEETRVGELEETLKAALALLASRLAGVPLGEGKESPVRALELIELGPVAPDWLAGPGAAARIADEIYERIAQATQVAA